MSNLTKQQILDQLKQVIDPEIGINIVDLGFIYTVETSPSKIHVKYTLTNPGCPLASLLETEMRLVLNQLTEDEQEDEMQVVLEKVFAPPWSPEKMSSRAKQELGWN